MTKRRTALLGTLILCMCMGMLQIRSQTDDSAALQAAGGQPGTLVPLLDDAYPPMRHGAIAKGERGTTPSYASPRARPCSETVVTYPYNEDFENGEGGWQNSEDDDYDWTLNQGETPTSGSGPDADHTYGTGEGHYMYTEASGIDEQAVAIFDGPCFDLSPLADPQFSFWYHMLGDEMGTMIVEVSADGCENWDEVWRAEGFQGGDWYLAVIDLGDYTGQTISIRYLGIRGWSYDSDMAIDDLRLGEYIAYDGGCCNLDVGDCLGFMKEADCELLGNTAWYFMEDCTQENMCPQPPPANDLCEDAIVVDSLPFVDEGVEYGWATPDLPVSCDDDVNDESQNGVWYTYTPDSFCGARVRQDCTNGGSNTFIAAFTGPDCGDLTEVFCGNEQLTSNTWQEVTFDMQGGTTYWILIGNYWSGDDRPQAILNISIDCSLGACCTGETCIETSPTTCEDLGGYYRGDHSECDGEVCLTGACCYFLGCDLLTENDCVMQGGTFLGNGVPCDPTLCPPINESCDSAIAVTDGAPAAEGATTLASDYDDAEASCEANSDKDLWYSYTPAVSSTVWVDTYDSEIWDTVLSVYDACYGEEIACEHTGDGSNPDQAGLDFDAMGGHTYYIRFAPLFGIRGRFQLNISSEEAPQGACCFGDSCTIDYRLDCEAVGGIYGGDGTMCPGLDCNGNGVEDICDILNGDSEDCNENLIPDECDIASMNSYDRDANGVPDECDPDCNDNGIIDGCDLTCDGGCADYIGCGMSADCQDDGIPDDCQLIHEGCDGVRYDTGYADMVSATRPDWGWAYVGIADDFTLDEDTQGGCVRFDIFAAVESVEGGDLNVMRVRIYENNAGLMGLGSFWSATPVFDATYSFDDENLEVTDTGKELMGYDLLRFVGKGEMYDLNAGNYAIHLTFPETWDVGFWATAGSDDSDCAVYWGDWFDYPTEICTEEDDFTQMSFALLGDFNNDQNENGVPDECDVCGDYTNPDGTGTDGVVDQWDYWHFLSAFASSDGDDNYDDLCDLIDDGRIDWLDYMAWVQCYRDANPDSVWNPPAPSTKVRKIQKAPQAGPAGLEVPQSSGSSVGLR